MVKPFVIIGHRGFSSKAPENTIAAFDLAASSGFPQIELDVQPTLDNIPVVINDSSLERTTNSRGLVKDFSLNQNSIIRYRLVV